MTPSRTSTLPKAFRELIRDAPQLAHPVDNSPRGKWHEIRSNGRPPTTTSHQRRATRTQTAGSNSTPRQNCEFALNGTPQSSRGVAPYALGHWPTSASFAGTHLTPPCLAKADRKATYTPTVAVGKARVPHHQTQTKAKARAARPAEEVAERAVRLKEMENPARRTATDLGTREKRVRHLAMELMKFRV